MKPAPFILLFQGRSGSTWLIDQLSSHPAVMVKGEALVDLLPAGAKAQHAWARSFLTRDRPASCQAVGFKSKLSDLLNPSDFAQVLREAGCRILHLDRENIVKQAISWMRSELLYASTGVHNIRALSERAPPTSLDPKLFAQRVSDLARGRRSLAAYVADLKLITHRLLYETLADDPAAELARVQSFIGLVPSKLNSDYIKHASNDLRHDVINLNELRASLSGTEWVPMFEMR